MQDWTCMAVCACCACHERPFAHELRLRPHGLLLVYIAQSLPHPLCLAQHGVHVASPSAHPQEAELAARRVAAEAKRRAEEEAIAARLAAEAAAKKEEAEAKK